MVLSGLIMLAAMPVWGEDGFTTQVARVFSRRCLSCHNAVERRGNLNLETRNDLFELGYVDRDDPTASLLIDVLTPGPTGKAEMPKDADPLTAEERAGILEWIRKGAAWPADYRIEESFVADLDWWSLQPLIRPLVPAIVTDDPSLIANPIDAFVLSRLKERGLSFTESADRRTLIRRVYFDLVGLPPTPAEIEEFVEDPDPVAYERLIDRLLSSPGYGERWARHWLDIVHYADTHGYDKDKLRENAWPYRDYVVRAFNEDRRYTRFVEEQIAGDALYPGTPDGMEGTGFIAAGPWDFIGHAEVPETKTDGLVARNLDRDDMVSTVMNTFVSTTVQCARCHHHKFDPIRQQHYYSLQAVFAALDRADRMYDRDPDTAAMRAELVARQQQINEQIKQVEQQVADSRSDHSKQLESRLQKLVNETRESGEAAVARSNAYGYHSAVAGSPDALKWVQVDLGSVRPLDRVILQGADEYGWQDFGFPEAYRIEISHQADFTDSEVLYESTAVGVDRPRGSAVVIDASGHDARFVRVSATRLWERRRVDTKGTGDWIFALGELTVLGPETVWPAHEVQSLDSIEALPRWGRENLIDQVGGRTSADGRLTSMSAGSPSNGFHSQITEQADGNHWVQLDLQSRQMIDEIQLWPAFPTDWVDTPGFGFPVRFRMQVSDDASFTTSTNVLDSTDSDFPNPGLRPVRIPTAGLQGRYIRLTATRLWDRGGSNFALALAELQVLADGRPIQSEAVVTASDSIDQGRWHTRFLIDGHLSRQAEFMRSPAIVRQLDTTTVAARRALETELEDAIRREVPAPLLKRREQLREQLGDVQNSITALPAQQVVYAGTVHHGQGAFRGRGGLGPRPIHVLRRGDVKSPAEPVQPGTIPILRGHEWQFELPADADESQRRVALAQWITHPDNPLTWRSIANRIWQYHIGRAIVDSPNDFGRMGQLPTHPQLLDWLAVEFRDGGQSFKHLHRLILTSRTYRQAVQDNPAAEAIDAENRMLWRMNRRKIEAELVRDSVLSAAGMLDRKMYGPGFRDFVLEKPQHSPHYEYDKYDPQQPGSHRRAVYRFLVRSQQEPFMETLDCADPSQLVARRNETLTALQALTLLNNKFMLCMSDHFAQRLECERDTLDERIDWACELTIGRRPAKAEREELLSYARQFGLPNLCRVLFNLNEFVFVD